MPAPQKPAEQIYAQTAAFADQQPYPHSRELSHRVGETAIALTSGQSVTTQNEHWDGRVEEHTVTPWDYVNFLRKADPETRADIAFLSDKMQAYSGFEESVSTTLRGAGKDSDSYLGSGSNGSAFRSEQDGKSFAVKTGGVEYPVLRAFRRGQNVDNIAHLEAINLDEKVSVMDLLPGRLIETMGFAERDAIPRAHLKDVIDTVIQMHEAGLVMDPKPSNFLYDPEHGFSILDYHAAGGRNLTPVGQAEQVMELGTMLRYHPPSKETPGYDTPEYEAWQRRQATEDVSLLSKFLDVLEEDYPDVLREAAVRQLEINNNPHTHSGGMVYDTRYLPEGEPFDSFKTRVEQLGLQGNIRA